MRFKLNESRPSSLKSDADIIREILLEKESDNNISDKMHRMIYEASLADDVSMDTDLIDECIETIELIEKDQEHISEEKLKVMRQKVDSSYEEWQKNENKRFFIRKVVQTAACFILILFVSSITANAFGYNIIHIIAKWGDETFNLHSQTQGESEKFKKVTESSAYDSVEKAFKGVEPKPLLPIWLPDGFSFKYAEKHVGINDTSIILHYINADKIVSFSYIIYKEGKAVEDDINYEKDEREVQEFEKEGVKHYIFNNINQVQAVWSDLNIIYNISGDISIEEIKKIIDYMYGG